jgi:hypothetical protein
VNSSFVDNSVEVVNPLVIKGVFGCHNHVAPVYPQELNDFFEPPSQAHRRKRQPSIVPSVRGSFGYGFLSPPPPTFSAYGFNFDTDLALI